MAQSALTGAERVHALATRCLGDDSPLLARQGEQLNEDKTVQREVESQGSLRARKRYRLTNGPTNRNLIRGTHA